MSQQLPPLTYVPPGSPTHHVYQCPNCRTNAAPNVISQMSASGWVFFFVFLIICLPVAFLGFTMKEERRICPVCGVDVGDATQRILQANETARMLNAPSVPSEPMSYTQKVWMIGGIIAFFAVAFGVISYLAAMDRERRAPLENHNSYTNYNALPTPTPTISPKPRAPRKAVSKPSPASPNDPVIISTAPSVTPTPKEVP